MIQPLIGISGLPKGPGKSDLDLTWHSKALTLPHSPDFVGGMLSDKNLPMVGILELDEHLQRRRAWNRGLSPGALKEYEARVSGRAQQLIRRLEEQKGEVILGTWINYFSYVSSMFLSQPPNTTRIDMISCVTWRMNHLPLDLIFR